ncbi:MAG: hypothetical protein A2580_09235 [Hydrogenophilales bacterium RIFOXYD1_FULL_62_11]|nr:MAG: hypothetical protein A2580_09235 [Hydrogenophilales bacterium RIFOXYD1_FULL_62_11]
MTVFNISLAAFPGQEFAVAMARAAAGVSEPLLGQLAVDHVQLCPQNRGLLSPDLARHLAETYPATQFRVHANTRVVSKRQVTDLDRFDAGAEYWQALAHISQLLGAPAYSAHAGLKANATLEQVLDNTRRAADLFGVPVAIEGHYPTPRGIYLLDTWEDYRTLLESGVPYALDLSHLHILAVQSGRREEELVKEMLGAQQCLEIHVSGNNGARDSHEVLDDTVWWWPLLSHTNPDAVVFSEGTQRH